LITTFLALTLAFFHNVNENEYVSAFLVPFELISSVQTHTIKSATAFCCFAGCNVIIYPGAFEDYDTGPLEWDVLNKARAFTFGHCIFYFFEFILLITTFLALTMGS
jgi:hypothetical protein